MKSPDVITHYNGQQLKVVDQDHVHFCTFAEVYFLLYLYYTNLHHFHKLEQKTVVVNGAQQLQSTVQKGILSHPVLNTIAASVGGVHFGDPTTLVVGLNPTWVVYQNGYPSSVFGRPCGRKEDWELSMPVVRYLLYPDLASVSTLLLRHFLVQENLGMNPDQKTLYRAFMKQLEIFRVKNQIPKSR